MWTRLRLWFAALYRRTRFEHQLDDELAFHMQSRAEEWERRGLSAAAARRRARIEFGNVERIKEETRDVRLGAWLELLGQDLRYGFRVLRAHPGITAVGVTSLALGMAVCIYMFLRLDAGVLRPLPGARDPGSLVAIDLRLSYPAFERIREADDVVEAATAYLGPAPFTVAIGREAGGGERVFGHLVSPDYFEALGVAPAAGRLFAPGTERVGSEPVVVVSERFWRRRLDADPGAVGRSLRVNGRSVTLAGIAANGFQGVFPVNPAEIFVPVTAGAALLPELEGNALSDPTAERFEVVARLASGVSTQTAEAALDATVRAHEPPIEVGESRREGPRVQLFPAGRAARVPPAELRLMLGVNGLLVGLVLSLACANLAGLLLARAGKRRREMAVRFALGASRWRLVRQLLAESVLLALGGVAAGLVLSYWLNAVVESAGAANPFPFEVDLRAGPTLWLFVLSLAVLTGTGLGLAPALAATRGARDGVTRSLQGGPPSALVRYRRFGVRNLFVTYQVAVALMLLLTIGQLAVGYQRFSGIDAGFDTAELTLFAVDPGRDGYTPAQSAALLDELSGQLAALPEVRSAALAERAPVGAAAGFGGVASDVRVSTSTAQADAPRTFHSIALEYVGVRYFETLGVPVVRGRALTERDLAAGGLGEGARAAETAVVINQTAEQQIFGPGGAIGRRLRTDDDGGGYVVVGVVPDIRPAFLAAAAVATAFVPMSAAGGGRASSPETTVLVRGMSGGGAMAAVRGDLERTHPRLTIFDARTMDEHLERFERLIRLGVGQLAGLSLFGLVLAAIGLTGVTSYAVTRRRKEIGIRLALGARRSHVLWLILRESTFLVVAGALLGATGAFALSRVLSALAADLAQILATVIGDPVMIIGGPALLAAAALVASAVPACRSVRIDPTSTLRAE
ncbi:MAG: ABC transporter permease [Spirochaetaceae bacterium]|nr:ABC transporter permease [Spirochaetaceae bacterium]